MDEDFWDKYLAKRSSEMEAAEEERRKRLEKAKRQERSWELMRVIRDYIEEVKANSWFRNKEIRRVREKAESEKRERLERASKKKEELGKRIEVKKRQQNLIEMMKKLPSKEQEAIEIEERKMKRLELQEIKENLWRKWRGKKDTRDSKVENEDEIEIKTRKVEDVLAKIAEEKRAHEEKTKEWLKRREKMLREGREKQAEAKKGKKEKRNKES